MSNRRSRNQVARVPLKDFVTVAFAEDMELAKHYKKLLSDENIPVTVKSQPDSSNSNGIAVMVPEDNIDEAHLLIESQNEYNDFYDMVFNTDDFEAECEDFEEDLFDDNEQI